eukprot:3098139-Rhodomonas_salina.1
MPYPPRPYPSILFSYSLTYRPRPYPIVLHRVLSSYAMFDTDLGHAATRSAVCYCWSRWVLSPYGNACSRSRAAREAGSACDVTSRRYGT